MSIHKNKLYPWIRNRRYLWTPVAVGTLLILPLVLVRHASIELKDDIKEVISEIFDLMFWRVK